MQHEETFQGCATASSENAVRWCRFDRDVHEIKARHADIPVQELQGVIDEACAAVRQEMGMDGANR